MKSKQWDRHTVVLGLASIALLAVIPATMLADRWTATGERDMGLPAELSADQRNEIVRIAERDPRTRQYLRGRPYEATVEPWRSTLRPSTLIGGMLIATFQQPHRLRGVWYFMDYDCTEEATPPYHGIPYRQGYRKVTELTIHVHLQRRRVIGVEVTAPPEPYWSEGPAEIIATPAVDRSARLECQQGF